ncbi:hypothetical protein J7I87_02680 [Staphylococcus warneri]|nr:hypothetical protein [Staphylococcus warneri]MBT2769138.1 hypothetical protein [Staphylococcus warneri]
MNKLQLIKIALLTALLVEEVRNAKKKKGVDSENMNKVIKSIRQQPLIF